MVTLNSALEENEMGDKIDIRNCNAYHVMLEHCRSNFGQDYKNTCSLVPITGKG